MMYLYHISYIAHISAIGNQTNSPSFLASNTGAPTMPRSQILMMCRTFFSEKIAPKNSPFGA